MSNKIVNIVDMDTFTERGHCPRCGRNSLFTVFKFQRDAVNIKLDMECPLCLYRFQLEFRTVGIGGGKPFTITAATKRARQACEGVHGFIGRLAEYRNRVGMEVSEEDQLQQEFGEMFDKGGDPPNDYSPY